VSALAKLHRPKLPAVYVETRLLARLDRTLSPVVWLVSPPGAGKTTALSAHLEGRRGASVWYRVDEGDGDPGTFFHYMRLAIRQAVPRVQLPAHGVMPETALRPFARRFFRAAFERLGQRVLVLDNYQDAPRRSPFQDVLAVALSELPPGASVLVASRTMPPPALARLRADGVVSVVPPDALALTRRETARLARARGAKLTARQVEELHRTTGGWAAGVVLMLAGGSACEASRTRTRAPKDLLEYFASEVFDRLPAPARRVLLETALLPRIPGHALERLTGDPAARGLMAELARTGYFTVRLEQQDEAYEYHPLFRQYLLDRAEEELEPERRRQVRGEAARMLGEAGEADAAADLFRAAGDWDGLAQLVRERAPELVAHARLSTLGRWIGALPGDRVERDPWLLYWLGQTVVLETPAEGRGHLERAFGLFFERGDAAGAYLAWASITQSHLYAWDDLRPLDRWIEIFGALRRRWPSAPTPEIEASVVGGMFTALSVRQPDHPEMEAWRERARSVAAGPADLRLRRAVGFALVHFEALRPDYAEARRLVEALAPAPSAAEGDPATALQWSVCRALMRCIGGEGSKVVLIAKEGLELAARTGMRHLEMTLRFGATWGHLLLDDFAAARADLKAMSALPGREPPGSRAVLEYLAGILALKEGELAQALRYAECAGEAARAFGNQWFVHFAEVLLAAVRVALGDAEPASQIAQSHPLDHPYQLGRAFAAGVAAAGALRRGEDEMAAAFLRTAFGIGARGGSFWHPFLSREQFAELCAFALEREIEPAHARAAVRLLGLSVPARAPSGWPWPVRVRTLGRFEVETEAGALRFERKVPRKPLELLQALVALGPGFVPVSALSDALWPQLDGDAALHALETALYRLRKLLPGVVVQRARKLSIDRTRCWSDVDELERLASKAAVVPVGAAQPPNAFLALAREALSLYQGPFLAEEDAQAWTLKGRMRARAAARQLLAAAGNGSPRQAASAATQLMERLVEVDPHLPSCPLGALRPSPNAGHLVRFPRSDGRLRG
jgi:LuxR family maltose regulon positive regulatory protein